MDIQIPHKKQDDAVRNGISGFLFGGCIQLFLYTFVTPAIYLATVRNPSLLAKLNMPQLLDIIFSILFAIGIGPVNLCTLLGCPLWLENYSQVFSMLICGTLGAFLFTKKGVKTGALYFCAAYLAFVVLVIISVYLYSRLPVTAPPAP